MSQNPSQTSVHSENLTKVQEIVNNFIMKYSKEIDNYEKTKMLHSFTLVQLSNNDYHMFLDSNHYLKILYEVPNLCKTFLTVTHVFNSETESDKSSSILTKNLENAALCFEIVQKTLKATNVISLIIPTTEVALSILFLGYNHCQDSEKIYGEMLQGLAEKLGMFFKNIESLQMIMLEKMAKLCSVKQFEDVSASTSLLSEFGNVCEIVSNLDPNTAFELWTMYIKLLSHHYYLLLSLDVCPVITCLVSKSMETLQLNSYNLEQEFIEDEECCTTFSFYLNTLSSILSLLNVSSPNSLKKHILNLQMILLKLLEFLCLCFSPFQNKNLNNFKDYCIANAYSLLSSLLKGKELLEVIVVNEPMEKMDDFEIKQLKTVLLLSNICSLQFIQGSCIQKKKQIFCNILSILAQGNEENEINFLNTRLPRCAVTRTDSSEIIDLYQFAQEELSELLKSFPDSSAQELNNRVFIELPTFSDLGYLLISDVWSYRLRCSTVSFLRNQCRSALQNYNANNEQQKTKLESFFKRMIKFLPPIERNSLCKEFSYLPFIQENDQIQHRHGIPDFFFTDYEFENISNEKLQEMILKLIELDYSDVLQLIQKSILTMEICAVLVSVSGSNEICHFIELAGSILKSGIYEVQVAVLTFIKAFSLKHLPENSEEFGHIVDIMAELFSSAINSKNYFISCEALNTFSIFAKHTPHIKIVQETVRRNPSLKPLIKSYISTVPETGFLTEEEKKQLFTLL